VRRQREAKSSPFCHTNRQDTSPTRLIRPTPIAILFPCLPTTITTPSHTPFHLLSITTTHNTGRGSVSVCQDERGKDAEESQSGLGAALLDWVRSWMHPTTPQAMHSLGWVNGGGGQRITRSGKAAAAGRRGRGRPGSLFDSLVSYPLPPLSPPPPLQCMTRT